MSNKEQYLGDGLYARHDGYQFILRAPRSPEDHWIGLEPDVLQNFIDFVASKLDVIIETRKREPHEAR